MVQKTVWKKHIGILPIFLAYKLKIKKKTLKWKKKFKFFPTILLSNTFLKKLLNWQHRAISFSAGVNSVCGFGVRDFWFKVWFCWNEPRFEWVQMFTCQVWSNWKLVIFGFDLTLKFSLPNLMKGRRFFFFKAI